MSRGVLILGMHRSGTSAATRLVNLLGVPTSVEEDLLPVTADNPRGYWESRSLTAFNDRIFAAFESDWSCPPELDPGWEKHAALDELRSESRNLVSRVFPTDRWVWKDPRNCITLPFWLGCLEAQPVIVLVHRNPLEIAASLAARDDLRSVYSLALWERYLRVALSSVSGLPTLVTTYDEILDDPLAWSEGVRDFLGDAGVASGKVAANVRDAVDTALRHTRFRRDDVVADPMVSSAQRELLDAVDALRGPHAELSVPALSPETPTTEALLGERRRRYPQERKYRELGEYSRSLGEQFVELQSYSDMLGTQFVELQRSSEDLWEQFQELQRYSDDLGRRFLALEKYARTLQEQSAAG